MVEGVAPDKGIRPRTRITADPVLTVAIRLARAGYCGGDPERVLDLPARIVVPMLDYERFLDDYQRLRGGS